METFGRYEPVISRGAGLALGALAVVSAAALLELSRTMAETYRGKWFAGNGRDVFHALAVGVLASALVANGFSLELACVAAAATAVLPLLLLDDLPPRRRTRLGILLALLAVASAPLFVTPLVVVDLANSMARALFR